MYYYSIDGALAASALSELNFPAAEAGTPSLFLLDRDSQTTRTAFRVTDSRQLTAEGEDVSWLDPDRMGMAPELP